MGVDSAIQIVANLRRNFRDFIFYLRKRLSELKNVEGDFRECNFSLLFMHVLRGLLGGLQHYGVSGVS